MSPATAPACSTTHAISGMSELRPVVTQRTMRYSGGMNAKMMLGVAAPRVVSRFLSTYTNRSEHAARGCEDPPLHSRRQNDAEESEHEVDDRELEERKDPDQDR